MPSSDAGPPLTTVDNARQWARFLPRWALLTALAYLGLMVLFITLVLPASSGSLPEELLELDVAGTAPGPYRLAVVFDVLSWLGIGVLLLAWGAVLRSRAPLRATFIAASSAAALIGFLGACLRLSATPELASRYLAAPAGDRGMLLEAYRESLNLINVTFSAGGLVVDAGLLLVAIVTWRAILPRWAGLLIGLGAALGIAKAAVLLVAGVDLGPVALLGAALLIAGFTGTAVLSGGDWQPARTRARRSGRPPSSRSSGRREQGAAGQPVPSRRSRVADRYAPAMRTNMSSSTGTWSGP
ncbi:hypothetical protein GCM10010149_44360 [Nonomuraea roseoviolacea subsp. roseoviolacea]|uniref:Flippase GtrA n=1 Tax=Nonomuraea roseoviolacea subsp. carminata TaxID=160689 RepID=A0ABT1JZ68_9ACTN|nr:hypothetical protein [Nonomuraea roseoviolacea]MCP2347000.1 putative flippase GtrA [Nonomuraea roseoviolacea subsp. carminata]